MKSKMLSCKSCVVVTGFLVLMLTGASCDFMYDLFEILELYPGSASKGVSGVNGPLTGTRAIHFGTDTGDIVVSKTNKARLLQSSYLLNSILSEDDITFSVWFNMTKNVAKSSRTTILTLFTIMDFQSQRSLFKISILTEDTRPVPIEGEKLPPPRAEDLKNYVAVSVRQSISARAFDTKFELSKETQIIKDQWNLLMVRIRGKFVTVHFGAGRNGGDPKPCKIIPKKDSILQGAREGLKPGQFPYSVVIRLSQESLDNAVTNRFVGAMYQPKILVGTDAYDLLNACYTTPINEPVVPEPKSYDPTLFNKFAKMMSKSSTSPSLFCIVEIDGKTERIINGDVLKESPYNYMCKNGVVEKSYSLEDYCEDYTGKVPERKVFETWQDEKDPCKSYKCSDSLDSVMTLKTCNTKCNEFGVLPKKADECCPVCKSQSCGNDANMEYRKGCIRTCEMGPRFKCDAPTEGCFCKDNYALNKGKCIYIGECPCKSGTRTYNAGETVVREVPCVDVTCVNGEMWEIRKCYDF